MQDPRIGVLCSQRELGGTSHSSDARAELRWKPLDVFGSLFFFSPFGSKTRQLANFLAPVLYIVGIVSSFEICNISLCLHLSHFDFFNSCSLCQHREKLLRKPTEHRPCLHRPTPSRRKETNRHSRPQKKRASRCAVSANKNRRNINAPGATCHSTFRASLTPKGPRRCLSVAEGGEMNVLTLSPNSQLLRGLQQSPSREPPAGPRAEAHRAVASRRSSDHDHGNTHSRRRRNKRQRQEQPFPRSRLRVRQATDAIHKVP